CSRSGCATADVSALVPRVATRSDTRRRRQRRLPVERDHRTVVAARPDPLNPRARRDHGAHLRDRRLAAVPARHDHPREGDPAMKAVRWYGKRDVRVEEVPDPKIEEATDAIVRITSTNICGSDLHLYEVLSAFMEEGDILG